MEKVEAFRLSEENLKWLKENYDRLKREYNGKWVVIKDQRVYESRDTFDEILEIARKQDPNSILIEYLQKEQIAMFF